MLVGLGWCCSESVDWWRWWQLKRRWRVGCKDLKGLGHGRQAWRSGRGGIGRSLLLLWVGGVVVVLVQWVGVRGGAAG